MPASDGSFESFTPEEDASARAGAPTPTGTPAQGWATDPFSRDTTYTSGDRSQQNYVDSHGRTHHFEGQLPGHAGDWSLQGPNDSKGAAGRLGNQVLSDRGQFQAHQDQGAADAQQYALHALQSQAFHPVSQTMQGAADAAQRNAYVQNAPAMQAAMSGSQAARGLMSALSMQGASQNAGAQQGQNITNEAMNQNLGAMQAFGQQAGAIRGQNNAFNEFNANQNGLLTGNVYNALLNYFKSQRDRQNAQDSSNAQAVGDAGQAGAAVISAGI